MKTFFGAIALLISFVQTFCADAPFNEHLARLKPFLGSWRGEFKRSTPENPLIDVAVWERALNGQALRIVHSINEGVYGGETIVTWDDAKKEIVYHYFSTGGFQTKGIMKPAGKKLECHEVVTGGSAPATEVKATFELNEDGTLEVVSKYLKAGEWIPGHEIVYRRAEGAQPRFK